MAESGEPSSLYVYAPNKGAPIFFAVAYAISAFFHLWQCYRYKSWRLIGLHPLCAVLFTLGYALREYGAYNYLYVETDKAPLILFIPSQVFIFICPPLLELANYQVLGRMFHYLPHCAPFPPDRIVSAFGTLMMLVEGLNGAGAALSSNATAPESTQEAGSNLTIAALSIQFLVIVSFACLAVTYHMKCVRSGQHPRSVKTLMVTLYVSMVLIMIRCIYRLVEHTTGGTSLELDNINALRNLSPVLRYEVYFYIFEATLMLINSVLWNVWNPGRFLPHNNHIYLAQDGTEVEAAKVVDKRPLLIKISNRTMVGHLFFHFCGENLDRHRVQSQKLKELSGHDRHEESGLCTPSHSH